MLNCFGFKYLSSGITFVSNGTREIKNIFELYYVISGEMRVSHKSDYFVIKKTEIAFFNPRDEVIIEGDFFAVKLQIANEIFRDNLGLNSPYFSYGKDLNRNQSIKELTDRVDSLVEMMVNQSKFEIFQTFSIAYAILDRLVSQFLVSYKTVNDNNLDEILEYIEENAHKQLSLSKLADHFHLNPSYLSRYFKKVYGIGYHEYLTNYRVVSSLESLLYTNENIGTIALNYGFNNLNSYTKHFQKKFATTPQKYRKKMAWKPAKSLI